MATVPEVDSDTELGVVARTNLTREALRQTMRDIPAVALRKAASRGEKVVLENPTDVVDRLFGKS